MQPVTDADGQSTAVCAGWPTIPSHTLLGHGTCLAPLQGELVRCFVILGLAGDVGRGLFAATSLPRGAWVAPYSGLLKTAQEAQADKGAPCCCPALLALVPPCM